MPARPEQTFIGRQERRAEDHRGARAASRPQTVEELRSRLAEASKRAGSTVFVRRTIAVGWAAAMQGWLALSGCAPAQAPRDILLVTVDTLRADHVSAYGHPASPATPAFDRLAAEGILFEQAIAPAPLTLPSHASILTGQWPFRHGVRDNGGFRLRESVPTLAQVLRARGYRTAAFVGAFVLDSRFGLDRGFDVYDDAMSQPRPAAAEAAYLGDARRDGESVARSAAQWLAGAATGTAGGSGTGGGAGAEPIFLWVHLYDPHAPYEPAPAFRARYPGRPYAGCVAQADAALGLILEAFERRRAAAGERREAVVAVAADHGESLGEHGEATHGVFVYDAAVRVPLAIRAPALPRRTRIPWQARLVDLAPTLLALAAPRGPDTGHAGPMPSLAADGVDLSPALRGEAPPPDLPAYAESLFGVYHYGWSPLRALRQGKLKWIEAPRPELYNLERDPAETVNLLDREPNGGRALSASLAQLAGEAGGALPSPATEDPEALARLRALGYVGGGPDAGRSEAGRPDPKDGIVRHARFEAGFRGAARRFDAGDYAAAASAAGRLLQEFPQARDARRLRALAALNQGKDEPARRDLDVLIREDAGDSVAQAALGRILERKGERAAALAAYRRALEAGPERADLRLRCGRLLRLEGRLGEAEEQLQATLGIEPGLAAALFESALVALAAGDHAAALPLLEQAVAGDPALRGAHHNLALLYEEKGDLAAARREYEAEIRAHPEAAASHLNLGLLLQRQGNPTAALRHLKAAASLGYTPARELLQKLDRRDAGSIKR